MLAQNPEPPMKQLGMMNDRRESAVCGVVFLNVTPMVSTVLTEHVEILGLQAVSSRPVGTRYVEVIQFGSEAVDAWGQLAHGGSANRLGCVAIMHAPTLNDYSRAFRHRAAVVLVDAEAALVAEVVAARLFGEIRVPVGVLSALLGERSDVLTEIESRILRKVVGGQSIPEVADVEHYSERHVRRILAAVAAKAGTADRRKAAEFFGVHEPPNQGAPRF